MKFIHKVAFTALAYLISSSFCFGTENLFYVLRNNTPGRMVAAQHAMSSLTQHFKSINILVPQAYQIDENGVMWGLADADTMHFAKQHAMKIMLLVTNSEFDKNIVHQFLSSPSAQVRAIQSMLDVCEKQHCYGVQLDFEMIPFTDREALTHFFRQATDALHKKGYIVSFAVAPLVSDEPPASDFLKKIYVNWEGAYDFKQLGEMADFISIMAYNQHGGSTTPGPTASIDWVEATIVYALQFMPASKISLGIPVYSTYWFTGTDSGSPSGKITSHSIGVSYEKMLYLAHKYKANLQWDEKNKLYYTIYQNNWLNEYIFAEEAKSFSAKLALAKKYHLRGISVFDLGTEDPGIWKLLSG